MRANRLPEQGDIEGKYELVGRPINRGEYWFVQLGKCRKTNLVRRILVLLKEEEATCPQYSATLKVLTMVDHPSIGKVYEIIENDEKVFIVCEHYEAGDLFDRIMENERLTEQAAKVLFKKLIECLEYLHSLGIILRDLKPESFQFVSPFDLHQLRLVDFSAAQIIGTDTISSGQHAPQKGLSNEEMKEAEPNVHPANIECLSLNQPIEGPPFYRSPESVKGMFTEKGDLWSAGALLYLMLLGRPPFSGGSDEEILEQVSSGKFDKGDDFSKIISGAAQNLICSLLTDETTRLTISQIKQHPWLAGATEANVMSEKKGDSIAEKKEKIILNDELLQVIAEADSDEVLERVLEDSRKVDQHLSNCLKAVEFLRVLQKVFPTQTDKLFQIFSKQIGDKNAKMDYTEYVMLASDVRIFRMDQLIVESFRYFDANQDEKVTFDDVSEGVEKESKFKAIGVRVLDRLKMLGETESKKELNLVEYKSLLSLK
jgi:calcium-dependent protein kinase